MFLHSIEKSIWTFIHTIILDTLYTGFGKILFLYLDIAIQEHPRYLRVTELGNAIGYNLFWR